MITYCLFCDTAKCEVVARRIREQYHVIAIKPKIVQRKWIKGKSTEEIHDYLPGYIFVYAQQPIRRYIDLVHIDSVYRILGESENNYQLQGEDHAFAEMLYRCNGTIGIMKAYKEGDKVRLAKGMLGNTDGEIVKTDRRGRALVRYRFDKQIRDIWVGYELIEDTVNTDEVNGTDL